jgi:peptidyl-prolyl cis-trans isomerase B (cyclophilin B)
MVAVLLIALTVWVGSCSSNENEGFALTAREGYETVARLETTQGEITVRFHAETAPAHVTNFINLCASGFYNGTYFHRVSPEFLIQGGDPNSKDEDTSNDGWGGHTYAGPQTTLKLEPRKNSVYSRGSVVMARTSELDSAGSQFFILLSEKAELEGEHTVLGEVIDGIEVADLISEEPGEPIVGLGGFNPTRPQFLKSCTLEEIPLNSIGTESLFIPEDSAMNK